LRDRQRGWLIKGFQAERTVFEGEKRRVLVHVFEGEFGSLKRGLN